METLTQPEVNAESPPTRRDPRVRAAVAIVKALKVAGGRGQPTSPMVEKNQTILDERLAALDAACRAAAPAVRVYAAAVRQRRPSDAAYAAAEEQIRAAKNAADSALTRLQNVREHAPRVSRVRVPKVRDVFEDIRQLARDFERVEIVLGASGKEPSIAVITAPVTLVHDEEGTAELGRFRVLIPFARLASPDCSTYDLAVSALTPVHNRDGDGSYFHPHVSSGESEDSDGNSQGTLCTGQASNGILGAMAEGRLADLFSLASSVLNTYNDAGPYEPLNTWTGVRPQETCHDCDDAYDDDSGGTCESCSCHLCESCQRFCEHSECSNSTCSDHETSCEECSQSFCSRHRSDCPTCSSRVCAGCSVACPRCRKRACSGDINECVAACELCKQTTCNRSPCRGDCDSCDAAGCSACVAPCASCGKPACPACRLKDDRGVIGCRACSVMCDACGTVCDKGAPDETTCDDCLGISSEEAPPVGPAIAAAIVAPIPTVDEVEEDDEDGNSQDDDLDAADEDHDPNDDEDDDPDDEEEPVDDGEDGEEPEDAEFDDPDEAFDEDDTGFRD